MVARSVVHTQKCFGDGSSRPERAGGSVPSSFGVETTGRVEVTDSADVRTGVGSGAASEVPLTSCCIANSAAIGPSRV